MKISSLEIERFGIWRKLNLSHLSPGLNVFYGPNEAGKTTLMQFIRSCLYGCANDDRAKYIQMVLDARTDGHHESLTGIENVDFDKDPDHWVGGVMTVESGLGRHRLERRYLRRNSSVYDRQTQLEMKSGFLASGGLATWSGRFYPIPGKGIAESLVVSGPDGARLSDYFVKTLVNNIDESTFNNVFAIGLDELQRLGTLDETDAAQMLYRLSVGVDRVSLVQVLHQIVEERNQVFDSKGTPAILEGLLDQKDRLAQRMLEPAFHLREYSRITGEVREARELIRQLQEKIDKNNEQKRIYEITQFISADWDARTALRNEIAAMGQVLAVEEAALSHSQLYMDDIKGTRDSIDLLRDDYDKWKKELAAMKPDSAVLRNAPRIEILEEDIPRLEKIGQEIKTIQTELTDLSTQLAAEELRLKGTKRGKIILTRSTFDSLLENKEGTLTPSAVEKVRSEADRIFATGDETTIREVEDFRVPARAVVRCRRKLNKQNEHLEQIQEQLHDLAEKLESGLTSHGQRNLTEAIESNSELVSSLRRRVDLARRMNEMGQYRKELEHQNTFFTNNLSLPTGPLLAVGLGVIAGGLLFGFSLLGKVEPGFGILGLILTVASFLFKSSVERKNFLRLEENQRQLGLLVKQLEQLKQEAQVIDTRYPAPGQSLDVRLQKAVADQDYFEKMTPLDTSWKEVNRQTQISQRRVDKATESLKSARRQWCRWLKRAGLPRGLKPSQIRELLGRVDVVEDMRTRAATLRNNIDLCGRERQGILDLLDRVQTEVPPLDKSEQDPIKLIQSLRARLTEARQIEANRKAQERKIIDLLRQKRKLRHQERKERREWLEFLRPYGTETDEGLKNLAERYQLYLQKCEKLATIQEKITSGIGGFCPEDVIARLIDDPEVRPTLSELLDNTNHRLETLIDEQREKLELAGRLDEQLAVLAAKKESSRWQFERASVDRRIHEMASLWQSRAIACRMMDDIRKAYERERQPETLREASRYLNVLTGGQYNKIWTPLGEDTLYVDTDQKETFDVGDLSRGTREQLFIAIRLALTGSFEKHGVILPLILDDVLVNFDNKRALAAAKLLLQFAKRGQQIFLFTCHRHICRIFLEMDTPIHVLPSRMDHDRQIRVVMPTGRKAPKISPVVQPKPVIEPTIEPVITIAEPPIPKVINEVPVPPKQFPAITEFIIPDDHVLSTEDVLCPHPSPNRDYAVNPNASDNEKVAVSEEGLLDVPDMIVSKDSTNVSVEQSAIVPESYLHEDAIIEPPPAVLPVPDLGDAFIEKNAIHGELPNVPSDTPEIKVPGTLNDRDNHFIPARNVSSNLNLNCSSDIGEMGSNNLPAVETGSKTDSTEFDDLDPSDNEYSKEISNDEDDVFVNNDYFQDEMSDEEDEESADDYEEDDDDEEYDEEDEDFGEDSESPDDDSEDDDFGDDDDHPENDSFGHYLI